MTDVGTPTPPPKKAMKRKKSLTQFVVMSKVEMGGPAANKAKQQYARDENTQEFYLLTHKCSVCGSQESVGESSEGGGSGVVNTTATTSTTSTSGGGGGGGDVGELERKMSNDWLSEKDVDEIDKIREGEGHHNRATRQKEEVAHSRLKNKLGMLASLRIQSTTREECDRRIAAATEKGEVSVNLNAFLITSDGVLRPFNAEHGGCRYEMVRNKHRDELIKLGRLHVDMLAHQEAFKQLFHLFLYLQKHSPPIDYLIYKRPIELLDGKVIDTLDVWDRLENIFEPKQTGYYYAIMGCIGFCLSTEK